MGNPPVPTWLSKKPAPCFLTRRKRHLAESRTGRTEAEDDRATLAQRFGGRPASRDGDTRRVNRELEILIVVEKSFFFHGKALSPLQSLE